MVSLHAWRRVARLTLHARRRIQRFTPRMAEGSDLLTPRMAEGGAAHSTQGGGSCCSHSTLGGGWCGSLHARRRDVLFSLHAWRRVRCGSLHAWRRVMRLTPRVAEEKSPANGTATNRTNPSVRAGFVPPWSVQCPRRWRGRLRARRPRLVPRPQNTSSRMRRLFFTAMTCLPGGTASAPQCGVRIRGVALAQRRARGGNEFK